MLPVLRLLDEESMVGQTLGDGLAQSALVIDEEEMFLSFRHLVGRGGILTPSRGWVNRFRPRSPTRAVWSTAGAKVFR